MSNNTINKEEVEKFSKIAEEWWNPNGKFKPLHKFNPIRIEYICLLYTSPSPRDLRKSRMPSSA